MLHLTRGCPLILLHPSHLFWLSSTPRFEKAFLLAVDIGSHDLFMDIHYLALDKGNTGLAEVAKQKADDLDDRSLDDYDDDDDDDVDSTDLSSEDDDEDEEDPEEEEDELAKLNQGGRKTEEILPGKFLRQESIFRMCPDSPRGFRVIPIESKPRVN